MSPDPTQVPGLAWPAPDVGPVPPPEYQGRPRDDDRKTRKPLSTWDRLKFIVALAVVFLVLFWANVADNPIIPIAEAFNETLRTKWWLIALMGVEALRQLHYMAAEHSAGYHRFWSEKVFGGIDRRTHRINDWNRFRMGRALKYLFLLGLVAVIIGAATGTSPVMALFGLPKSIWAAMPMLLQVVFFMFIAVIQFVAIFWFLSKGGLEVYFPDDIKTRFSDVWGQDAVVDRVKENILFLEDPEKIEAKGGYVPGGILLWGPPGTGKTLMAEAVAGETGRPYVFVDPGAFTNMFMGVGILKVKSLFRKLRKLAVRYGGVIVFFDEADALGSRGSISPQGAGAAFRGGDGNPFLHSGCNGLSYLNPNTTSQLFHMGLEETVEGQPRRRFVNRFVMGAGMGGGAGMGTLQALLTELSGLKKPRGFMNRVVRRTLGMRPKPPPKYRLLVMMATNMPEALDEALLRPGRIDRIYKVGYPHKAGRVRTYEGYLAKVRHILTPQQIDKLATITPYATGATIKDLVNEALIVAIRDGREEISWQDVIRAKQLKAMGPSEDAEYVERERHAIAVHEACHAVVAFRARRHATIDIATIERRGDVGGFVSAIPPEDRFTQWRSEYEADIMTAVASLAGERMFFDGDNSSGVSNDLLQATNVATLMEGYWGMGSTYSSHEVTSKRGIGGGGRGDKAKPGEADLLAGSLGERIEEKLAELFERTEEMLKANRLAVLAVAHALETYRTITGDDVAAVIEGRQGPLIDGRAYRDPEFARLAEAYHAQVVAAHKGQGIIDIPLPVLNGNGHRPAYASDVIVLPDSAVGHSPWARPAEPRSVEPRPPAPASAPAAPQAGDGAEGEGNGHGGAD